MWIKEKKIFITGTDTGVGKTFVSLKIIQMYEQNGIKSVYFKPVATGGILYKRKLVSEDVLLIKNNTHINESFELMNPVIYKIPAAPVISEEYSLKKYSLKHIFDAYKSFNGKYESVVVEGVGGIMVPLKKKYLVLDLVKDLNLPVVIVSRPLLGTINHTLMTIEMLKKYKLRILGIVISHASLIKAEKHIRKSFDIIERYSGIKVIKEFNFENQVLSSKF